MRVTNIDTLSAYFDRLITENVKLFFFEKDRLDDKVAHQKVVLQEIKKKLSVLLEECIGAKRYDFLKEHRTFNENAIVEELEELVRCDVNIGESDRARLQEVQSDQSSLERLVVNEKRLRKSNEGRARHKNEIDQNFSKMVEE